MESFGILVFVLSLPDNWKLRLSHLSKEKEVGSGRDATRAGLRELQQAGYLFIQRERGECGKFVRTAWLVTDRPGDFELDPPRSDFPNTVNPASGKS